MLLLEKRLPSMLFVLLLALVFLQQPLRGSVAAKKMKDIFSNSGLGIFCNLNPEYGVPTNIIATVKELPDDITFLTRIYSTSNLNVTSNMIMRFMTPMQEGEHWSKTSNLKSEFDRLEIQDFDEIPFTVGYYVSTSHTFYQYNNVDLLIELIRKKVHGRDATSRHLALTIKKPLDCLPTLNIRECANSLKPINVEVSEYFPLNAVFENKCPNNGTRDIRYKWAVYDQPGQHLFLDLGETTAPELEIAAFKLSFTFADNAIKHRLMLEVSTLFKGTKIVAKCYIHLKHGQVKAVISGGHRRYVSVAKPILMDGSKSQDEGGGHNSDTLNFQWDCTSKSGHHHTYCRKNMNKEPTFSIPKNKMKLNHEYIYTLTVTSKEDQTQTSNTKQTIVIVDRDVISLEIVCVSNCRSNYFSSDKEVVLKGVCHDCGKQRIHYVWFLDNMEVEQKQTLKTQITVEKHKVHAKLTIETQDGRFGTEYLTLYENNGPVGGHCGIEPKKGQEIVTVFLIKCHGWVTENWPLRYYIIAKKVTLTACKSSYCEVQLPATNHVVVRVCDSLMICKEVQLPVNVHPWLSIPKIPEALKSMLNSSVLNIREIFKSGKEDKAHLIINTVATQIKTAEQGKVLLDLLKEHVPNNVFELGKMANLTRTLFDSFGALNTEDVKVITAITHLLNNNFQHIIDVGISHHLAYEPFKNITVSLMSVLRNLHNMTATLPKPPEYILKMIKNKPFNDKLLNKLRKEISAMPIKEARDRTTIWLESTYQLDRLNKFLNDANAWHVHPDEDLRPTFYGGISIQHSCLRVDENIERIIQTSDHIHVVHFSPELLEELSGYLKSKRLCLKVVSRKRDLGWWYPQERQPSKIMLSVSVYSSVAIMPKDKLIRNNLVYFVYLGKYKPATRTNLDDITKSLNRTGDPWHGDNGTFINENMSDVDIKDDDDDAALWLMEPFINLVDLSSISYDPNSTNDDVNDFEDTDNDIEKDNYIDYEDYDAEEDEEEYNEEDDDNKDITNTKRTFKGGDTNMKKGMDKETNRGNRRQKRVVEDDSDRVSSYGTYINALMHDSLNLYEEIHHYHVPLDEKSVLAVRFVNSSHDLRVYLSMNFAPRRQQTSNSKCYVLAGEQNRTILLSNNCHQNGFAFLAIRVFNKDKDFTCDANSKVIDGPAKYSFVLQIRGCDYWHSENNDDEDDESEWAMSGCMPTMTYNIARGMTCVCQYISTYTAYVFNLPARKIRSPPCISVLPVRAEVVLFFIFLYAILFALLIFSLFSLTEGVTTYCAIRVAEENVDGDLHNIIVIIRTGGIKNATTTANITITFQTYNYEELAFTLYQNPNAPVLKANTAYVIKFESRDIRLPTRLCISHDNAGRYPRWNVAYIQVMDQTTHQYQHFEVRGWIREGQLAVLTAPVLGDHDEPQKEKWMQLFRSSMERNFVNWWGFQPLIGAWRPTFHTRPMNRFERICTWIAKFVVALTIAFLYYGRTTVENFEEEFEKFHYSVVYVPFGDTVWVCCLSYIVINIVQYAYEFALLPLQDYIG